QQAMAKLVAWYHRADSPSGAILALPTGGGKTYTALRFLCGEPISDGYKVLWLAHTHHLLEQAYESLNDAAGCIAEPRDALVARTVSGTQGHFRAADIKPSDDFV